MPTHIRGIAGPIYSDEEMTVPRLSYNGTIIEGWVKAPADKARQPQDGDLLWLPPSATKSTDVDRAGSIVEVGPWTPGEDMAWVQAQLDKRERYLDLLRDEVRAGTLRLTAALAKMLGLAFGDGAELTPLTAPALGATLGTYKAATDARVDYERLEAMIRATGPERPTLNVKAIANAAAMRYVETGDLEAAMDGIFRAGRGRSAIDPDTGLPIVGGLS